MPSFDSATLRTRLARIETLALVALLATGALVATVMHVTSTLTAGDGDAWDRAALASLRTPGEPHSPIGPAWLDRAFIDLTSLGGTSVLTLVTVLAAGYLVVSGRRRTALALAAGASAGSLLSRLLKSTIERPRPQFIAEGVVVDTWSFPSGHAMLSAVIFLTIGALLAETEQRRRVKVYIMLSALLLTLIVGVSRVYLGVHYPTDVLAGWAVGAAWALIWREATRALVAPAPARGD